MKSVVYFLLFQAGFTGGLQACKMLIVAPVATSRRAQPWVFRRVLFYELFLQVSYFCVHVMTHGKEHMMRSISFCLNNSRGKFDNFAPEFVPPPAHVQLAARVCRY